MILPDNVSPNGALILINTYLLIGISKSFCGYTGIDLPIKPYSPVLVLSLPSVSVMFLKPKQDPCHHQFSNYSVYLKNVTMSHKLYWNHKQSRDNTTIPYLYSCTTSNKFGQFV